MPPDDERGFGREKEPRTRWSRADRREVTGHIEWTVEARGDRSEPSPSRDQSRKSMEADVIYGDPADGTDITESIGPARPRDQLSRGIMGEGVGA